MGKAIYDEYSKEKLINLALATQYPYTLGRGRMTNDRKRHLARKSHNRHRTAGRAGLVFARRKAMVRATLKHSFLKVCSEIVKSTFSRNNREVHGARPASLFLGKMENHPSIDRMQE